MRDLVLVYTTKSGNTKLIADSIADCARAMGLDAEAFDLRDIGPGEVLNAEAVAIGSPTYEQRMLPPIEKLLDRLDRKACAGKLGIAFGSYGWSGEAPVHIAKKMRDLGFNVLDPVIRVQYKPDERDMKACMLLGRDVALKLKSLKR